MDSILVQAQLALIGYLFKSRHPALLVITDGNQVCLVTTLGSWHQVLAYIW